MERIALLFILTVCLGDGFLVHMPNVGGKSGFSRMKDNVHSDPYDDLFNLNKPLDADASPSTVKLLDEIEPVVNTSSISFRGSSGATTERKNAMQAYIEEQFGELDGNLKEEEHWVSELRDVVELKRGFAIWSKRTDQEIKKEVKKSLASKGMNIPHNVANVINAVYVEKICNMGTIKKEEEIAYTEYKKWVREQRQKLKRDPVPGVKLELVKKWLQRHPAAKFTAFPVQTKRVRTGPGIYSRVRPSVVLDEISSILDAPSPSSAAVAATAAAAGMNDREEGFVLLDTEEEVEGMESSPAASAVGGRGFVGRAETEGDVGGGTGSRTSFSVLSAVPSVVNWHKSRRELQQDQYQPGGDQGRNAGEGRSERAASEYDVIRQSLVRRIRSAIERRGAPTTLSGGGIGDRRDGAGADTGLASGGTSSASPSTGQEASEEYFVVL